MYIKALLATPANFYHQHILLIKGHLTLYILDGMKYTADSSAPGGGAEDVETQSGQPATGGSSEVASLGR